MDAVEGALLLLHFNPRKVMTEAFKDVPMQRSGLSFEVLIYSQPTVVESLDDASPLSDEVLFSFAEKIAKKMNQNLKISVTVSDASKAKILEITFVMDRREAAVLSIQRAILSADAAANSLWQRDF